MDTNLGNFQMIDNIDDLNKINDSQYTKYENLMKHKIDQIKTADPKLAQAMANFMNAHDKLRRLLGKRTGNSFTSFFNNGILNIFKTAEAKTSEIDEAKIEASDALKSLNEAVKFQRSLEALEGNENSTNANVKNINATLTPEEAFEMQIKAKLGEIKGLLNKHNELENQFLNANEQRKRALAKSIAVNMQDIVLRFKDLDKILKETASAIKDSSNIKTDDINSHNLMINMQRIILKYGKFYNRVRELAFNAYEPADGASRSENLRNFQQFIRDNRNVIYTTPYLLDSIKEFDRVTDAAEWASICLDENSQEYANLSENLKMLMKNFAALALGNLSDEVIENYTNALETLKENIVKLKPIVENESVFIDVDFGDIENPMLIPGIAEQNELIKACNTLIAAFEAFPAPNQTMIEAVKIAKNVKQQHAEACRALIDADQAINALPEFSKIRKILQEKTQAPLVETQKQLTKVLRDALQNHQISEFALNRVHSGLDTNLKISKDILKSHSVVCDLFKQLTGRSLDELFDLSPQLQSFDFHKALGDFESFYALKLSDLGKIFNVSEGKKFEILHNIVEKFKRLDAEIDKARPEGDTLRKLALDTLESNNSTLNPKSGSFLRESLKKFRNVHALATQKLVGPNADTLALADEAAIDLIAHANDTSVVEEIHSNVPTGFSLHQCSEIAARNFEKAQTQLIRLINGVSDFYPNLGQYALRNIQNALSAYELARDQLNNVIKSYELLTENERGLRFFKEIDNYLRDIQQPYTGYTQQIAKVRDEFLQKHNGFVQRLMLSEFGLYDPEVKDSLEKFRKAASEISSEETEFFVLMKDFH